MCGQECVFLLLSAESYSCGIMFQANTFIQVTQQSRKGISNLNS